MALTDIAAKHLRKAIAEHRQTGEAVASGQVVYGLRHPG